MSTNDKLADALEYIARRVTQAEEDGVPMRGTLRSIKQRAETALAEHAASLAAPPAQELWCMHILGPDDVHPAPSKAAAEAAAERFNAHFGPIAAEKEVLCKAVVALWPHSPESHAASLPEWSQWEQPAPAPVHVDMLPERDPSRSNAEQGLYRKFDVRRTDGSDAPGGKHDGCEYFVLDLTHDEHAHAALSAYADACEREHPILAADLRSRYLPETCQDPEGYDEAGAQPPAPGEAELPPLPAGLDWPDKPFTVRDEPGEHDPCWLVMPGGEMLALNHHAINGVDQARARFMADACNARFLRRHTQDEERAHLLTIDQRDHAYDIIDKLCNAVLGVDRHEWSSLYGFDDAVAEVEERIAALAQHRGDDLAEQFRLGHAAGERAALAQQRASVVEGLRAIRNHVDAHRKGLGDEWQDWAAELVTNINALIDTQPEARGNGE